jgi:hypothetical protein
MVGALSCELTPAADVIGAFCSRYADWLPNCGLSLE